MIEVAWRRIQNVVAIQRLGFVYSEMGQAKNQYPISIKQSEMISNEDGFFITIEDLLIIEWNNSEKAIEDYSQAIKLNASLGNSLFTTERLHMKIMKIWISYKGLW